VNTVIRQLNLEETCKYLGVNEGDGINHFSMKENVQTCDENQAKNGSK